MNNSNKKEILNLKFGISTRAIDTYDACCDLFGFKAFLRGKFAPQKKLYAENATSEGYNVWMLAHNSLIEDFNKSLPWFNIIEYDLIREIWFDSTDVNTADFTPRVCFIKTKNGRYVFHGVFVLQRSAMEEVYSHYHLVRTFKRISSTYPINSCEVLQPVDKIHKIEKAQKSESNKIINVDEVLDGCIIEAFVVESNKKTAFAVDIKNRPIQKFLIGKHVGDRFSFPNIKLTYQIEKITFMDSKSKTN